MSGFEVAPILGIISSIVSIVDGVRQTYEAAGSAQGLPEAFRKVYGKLPLMLEILDTTKDIEESQGDSSTAMIRPTDASSSEAKSNVESVLRECEAYARALKRIFERVIPAADANRLERYRKAVHSAAPGMKQRVEDLATEMMLRLELLSHDRTNKNAIQLEKLRAAIEELELVPSSLPDENDRYNQSGAGVQHNASTGTQYTNSQVGGENNRMFNGCTFGSG